MFAATFAAAILVVLIAWGVFAASRDSYRASARGARSLLREIRSRPPVSDSELTARCDSHPNDGVAWCAVRRILAAHLGLEPENLLPDDDLLPLADDMDTVELLMDVEKAFNVTISDQAAEATRIISIRSLTNLALACPEARPDSHRCRDCAYTVLQFQDCCPECGAAVLRRKV